MTKSGRGRLATMTNVQYVLFMSEVRVDGVEVASNPPAALFKSAGVLGMVSY